MSKPLLGVDVDNVIADTDTAMRQIILRETGGLVDLAYEDIREFDYDLNRDRNGQGIDQETWKRVHAAFSVPEILSRLSVIDGALDGLRSLSDAFDIHFATSRLPQARLATLQWLEGLELGFAYGVHFVGHRKKHVCLPGFSAIVEDDREQAVLFAQAGVASILLAHPWNEVQKGAWRLPIARCGSWAEVVSHALEVTSR